MKAPRAVMLAMLALVVSLPLGLAAGGLTAGFPTVGGTGTATPVPVPGAKQLNYTSIDYPGAASTFAFGINPQGDIVGGYVDGTGREHGFLLRQGTFTSFDYPDSTWTEGWEINPRGDIVGQSGLFDGSERTVHSFLLRDGSFYPVDVPGQPNTMAVKISPDGTIAGCYHVANPNGSTILNTMYGFSGNTEGMISYPQNRTMHNGINPAGDVVGLHFSLTSNLVEQSYLIRNGVTTWFRFGGSAVTQAWDISPTGTIVGFHRTDMSVPPPIHGFVLEGDEFTSLDAPGASQTRAYGISATGDVVGYYYVAAENKNHGFLLTRRGSN